VSIKITKLNFESLSNIEKLELWLKVENVNHSCKFGIANHS